ncbi:MAG TPA: serine hydrolase [Cyclobacteriaceae bacterium]
MKKWIWSGAIVILITAVAIIARPILLILSGFGAKNLCSCVYNSGREPSSVLKNELGNFPLTLGNFYLDKKDSSATGSVLGFAKRTAVYKNGEGCTLLVDYSKEEFKQRKPMPIELSAVEIDTLPWPFGTQFPDTVIPGVNYSKLSAIMDDAFTEVEGERKKNTRGVVIVYDGQMILERYSEEFDPETPQMGWSMSKSIINALVGILVSQEKLDVYSPAPVPEWSDRADPRHLISIDQLLRMSSGIEWEENYGAPSSATNMLFTSGDMGKYTASLPLEAPPDSLWKYSSGSSNLLSRIIKQITDEDYLSFVDRELFSKLGIKSIVWEKDESGTLVGSSFMWASPRDWAKLGLLFLNDGVWNGERILPEGWVEYSSTPTPKATRGYGAHFWLNRMQERENTQHPDAPADMFSMQGFEDQRVFIIPSRKLVIVRLGQTSDEHFGFNAFLKNILECFPDR